MHCFCCIWSKKKRENSSSVVLYKSWIPRGRESLETTGNAGQTHSPSLFLLHNSWRNWGWKTMTTGLVRTTPGGNAALQVIPLQEAFIVKNTFENTAGRTLDFYCEKLRCQHLLQFCVFFVFFFHSRVDWWSRASTETFGSFTSRPPVYRYRTESKTQKWATMEKRRQPTRRRHAARKLWK